jgi:hypothetical protein
VVVDARRERIFLGVISTFSGACAMKDELAERFPKLFLQACELPTGEWIIASLTKPLTQDEAEKVLLAYQAIQELAARRAGGH